VRTRETRVHDQLLPWLPGRAMPPSFQVHEPKLKNNVILASTILNEWKDMYLRDIKIGHIEWLPSGFWRFKTQLIQHQVQQQGL
jgi:hypothetical protein